MEGAPYGPPLPVSPGRQSERRGDVSMKAPANAPCKQTVDLGRRAASLYVQSTGCQRYGPGCGWGPGVRDCYLLCCVAGGRGVYERRDRTDRLGAGDAFLVYPDAAVRYYADGEDPMECVWVGFYGADAAWYVEQTDFTPEEPVLRGGGEELLARLRAVHESRGTAVWEGLEATARLYGLLAHLVRVRQKQGGGPDRAQAAAEHIAGYYDRPVTVEELAALVSASHSSLYRRFVKRFHTSPKRFLLGYRIRRACELLAAGERYTLPEIANSVGFEDPFYFSHAFKAAMGVSPRRYAARCRKERETAGGEG